MVQYEWTVRRKVGCDERKLKKERREVAGRESGLRLMRSVT